MKRSQAKTKARMMTCPSEMESGDRVLVRSFENNGTHQYTTPYGRVREAMPATVLHSFVENNQWGSYWVLKCLLDNPIKMRNKGNKHGKTPPEIITVDRYQGDFVRWTEE